MRLNICVLGAEERLRSGNREGLDLVVEFAAAVVASSGIPLSVFISENGARCFHDRLADEVLRGDEF